MLNPQYYAKKNDESKAETLAPLVELKFAFEYQRKQDDLHRTEPDRFFLTHLVPGNRVFFLAELSGSFINDCAKEEMATCSPESEVIWKADKCFAFILVP